VVSNSAICSEPSAGVRTQAVTCALWTSSAAVRSTITSILALLAASIDRSVVR
jgi:molybdopterin biosynthesis enzyme MoaB